MAGEALDVAAVEDGSVDMDVDVEEEDLRVLQHPQMTPPLHTLPPKIQWKV
jgi:hypothetical protein